jgi:bifunctional UDP-N-acetylglucosamine pyrophosphorylase / glucosamine-1-phosphate N-acetyltransferase
LRGLNGLEENLPPPRHRAIIGSVNNFALSAMTLAHPTKPLNVVILAAGKGTRMKSAKPKVLQHLAGRALLDHVLETASQLDAAQAIVITGHQAEVVEAATGSTWASQHGMQIQFARQSPQLGTGHAVQQAAPLLDDASVTLVLSGDVPLTSATTLRELVEACGGDHLALLTVKHPSPMGYGRVIRNAQHEILAIVEHKDANEAQRAVSEIYSGIMAVPTPLLRSWLSRLTNHNAQQEYYLTDVVKFAVDDGLPVRAICIDDPVQVEGVNSPHQLAALERAYQHQQAVRLMNNGVRLIDPARLEVRGELVCGQDVEIDINCIFSGRVTLEDGVHVGAHSVLSNCTIGTGAVIHPYTHINGEQQGAVVGAHSVIGPFARLRPGAVLGQDVHIGNFVEVKNSTLANGAKANHLAYLGDAHVGERVNYGAGSITANYDGANKHRTVIEADVHVGSNCVLVAPVTLGAGGTIGAGSTITKDTPEQSLSVVRAKQVTISGWTRPQKTRS